LCYIPLAVPQAERSEGYCRPVGLPD